MRFVAIAAFLVASLVVVSWEGARSRQIELSERLRVAISSRNVPAVKGLLDRGVEVNAVDGTGTTPLVYSALMGNETIVRALLAAKAKVNRADAQGWTACMVAAARGNVPVLRSLVSAGADLNVTSEDGKTALMYAVDNDEREATRALIAAGADVNRRDHQGHSALNLADLNDDRAQVCQILIRAGAKDDRKDRPAEPDAPVGRSRPREMLLLWQGGN